VQILVIFFFFSYRHGFASTLTRRHTGAAFASGLPATNSICA
jgi:hypothetical protein